MYTVISGIGRLKAVGSPWITEDFGPMLVRDVIVKYEQVYFKVAHEVWLAPKVVKLSDLIIRVVDQGHTVAQAFEALGNTAIEAIDGEATIETRYVKMADAVQAGYAMKRVNSNRHSSVPVSAGEADSMVLSRSDVPAREFDKYCLVTVAGLLHLNDADDKDIYVMDAQITSIHSRRNDVGILNFRDIGELTKVPITADMVHKRGVDHPYANRVYIKTPIPYPDKTAAIVIGGYLHFIDGVIFKRIANDIFCVEFSALNFEDRYHESKHLIDLSTLAFDAYGANGAQYVRSEMFSDDVIERYMTLSQSFLVFIDSDIIVTSKEQLNTGSTYGQYVVGKRPRAPLMTGLGLLQAYWMREDDGFWSLGVVNNLHSNYLMHLADEKYSPNPADNRIVSRREEISTANLWHISSQAIVILQRAES